MRVLRSEWARDLDEQLGIINYSAVRPTIARRRSSGRWHVMPGPTLRPMSFGYVGWMAFLVFWIVFGRALLFFLMIGGFMSGSSKGLEVTLARSTERAWDLERFDVGLVVVNDDGHIVLDPDRHLVYRLNISTETEVLSRVESDMVTLCDESQRLHRIPTIAVASSDDVSYQDVVATIDLVRRMNYSHGCEPRFFLVSPRTEAATHNKRMHLSVTPLAAASVAPAGDAQRYPG